MEQYPFTPEGVDLKQRELYRLTDSELKIQADYIYNHLQEWVKANFTLTSQQVNYLDSMDGRFLTMVSSETSSAILNRLVITCRVHGRGTGAKRFNILKYLLADNVMGETTVTSGEFTLEFVYEG